MGDFVPCGETEEAVRKFDPNRTYYGPGYRDPERVPMILLALGLMVALVVFLVWAIQ